MADNMKEELEEVKQIEDIAKSSFFDYLISKKIDTYVNSKVSQYKYLLFFLGGILLSVLAYFGFDIHRTSEIISERSARIDSLEIELVHLSELSDNIIIELQSKFEEKYGEVSDLHLKIQENADQIDKSSGILNGSVSNVSGSISTIKEQWKFLGERASEVKEIQEDINDNYKESLKTLEDAEATLEQAKKRLEEIDRDDLIRRLTALEQFDEKMFSVFEGATKSKKVVLKEPYEFKVSDVKEQSCKVYIEGQADPISLSFSSVPTKIGEDVFIELVMISSTKDKLLQLAPTKAVTLRIYTEPKKQS